MLPPSAAPPLFPSLLDSSAPSNSRSSSGGGGAVRNRQISRTVHMSSSDNSLASRAAQFGSGGNLSHSAAGCDAAACRHRVDKITITTHSGLVFQCFSFSTHSHDATYAL